MERRRVLIVSYFYPPVPSVGGVRAAGLVRYLPQFGWDPVVLTPRAPGRVPAGSLIETGDRAFGARLKARLGASSDASLKDVLDVREGSASFGRRAGARAIELAKSFTAVPDQNRGWAGPALEAARAALAARPVHAIVSTSPPATAHLVARRLAREAGVPWIADFRDLWADNHNSLAPPWRRRIDGLLEGRTLRTATALVTVSEPLARTLARRHPGARVATITNGFDPDEVNPGVPLTREFTLTHTGTFYQGRRDPTLLFETLAALFADGRLARERVRLRFFSRHEDWIAGLVRAHRLEDVVEVRPWAPRAEALAAQRESQLLLLLHWGGAAEEGVYTGKVFEYLAARRPILVCGGGPGVLDGLLAETGAGRHVADGAALRATLIETWDEYVRTGRVTFAGHPDAIARYSHVRMAREFAALLD